MTRPPSSAAPDPEAHYPIRTVAQLTGVNPVTLRAWERRHGLIQPMRTASGHRLYGPAQIDTIHRILGLLRKGLPISQVERALAAPAGAPASVEQGPWNAYRERSVAAVARYDDEELEEVYSLALGLHPIETVTDRLLLPVLQELGRRWRDGEGSVAEEHFFSIFVRNKLGARFHHRARARTGARILAACLPDEQHELGLLIFSLAAHERGLRIVMLAAQTPLEDLPLAARRAHCDAIVLSSTITPPEDVIKQKLPAMVAAASVPVFVGGLASLRERDGIVAAGAEVVGTDIPAGIERIRLALGNVEAH